MRPHISICLRDVKHMHVKVEELKASMCSLIDNLLPRIESIAGLYYSGNGREGSERIVFLVDDIEALINGLHVLDAAQLSAVEEFNEILKKILQELENQDYYFVADLLTYEISPLLQHWRELIADEQPAD